ncbi:twin-arginine translocase subunit TatC [Leifsonia flava]|uniref:Sec-independent protein translocase protein TatC n=2 Tax=Orlajensenia leifsoniae TaxID=2561933 RepID=A0A4Y9RBS8_9MICO|nr:twin-arginine translocase subunit TatC [Leifsonia flava]TFW00366.1 twin-arginine translocase subunit TatC [Leifsonia flava]
MTLGGHLRELRNRLFIVGISLVIGAIAGWFLSSVVWDVLTGPVSALDGQDGRVASMNFDTITGAFDLRLRIALQLGLILSAPVWLYEVFAFAVPGLTRKESRITLGFLASAIPLFVGGCAAGLFVLPHVIELMVSFAPGQTASFLAASAYYDFVLKLVLAIGVAFVLPVFLVVLNVAGVLSGATILRSWRYALLAICLFTAIATPAADVFSMFLLAVPLVVLYFGAVGIALLRDRRAAKIEAALTRRDEIPSLLSEVASRADD